MTLKNKPVVANFSLRRAFCRSIGGLEGLEGLFRASGLAGEVGDASIMVLEGWDGLLYRDENRHCL